QRRCLLCRCHARCFPVPALRSARRQLDRVLPPQMQITTFNRLFLPSPPGNPTAIPKRFDERFYAVRTGLGDWVTGPTEIADDLFAVRMGIDQRWQTKRGFPGERTLQDLVVLNSGITFFPEADRDNFGEHFGLLDYDFRWHIGERTTL